MNESLNSVFVAGKVVRKRLTTSRTGVASCKVMLRLLTPRLQYPRTYVEVFAQGNAALRLDLCSARGNVIYVEGHFDNAAHLMKGGKPWMEMRLVADEVRTLTVSKTAYRDPDASSIAAVLAKFDPEGYLEGEGAEDDEKD